MTTLNRSLMELSLDTDEPITKCTCKGMCKRGCPCAKGSSKCGSLCKCKRNKCANQKEEAAVSETDFKSCSYSDGSLSDFQSLPSSEQSDSSLTGHLQCHCTSKCKRGCPRRNAGVYCQDFKCSCSSEK
ncbi:uncharacterized protein LOC135694363 [Rhopilema esculentum]|uniref:uncharacterized protein LOC135694363 n=1 Tax=Rhopilema esculentum TaxID=499914 RepID=UPI0031CF11D9